MTMYLAKSLALGSNLAPWWRSGAGFIPPGWSLLLSLQPQHLLMVGLPFIFLNEWMDSQDRLILFPWDTSYFLGVLNSITVIILELTSIKLSITPPYQYQDFSSLVWPLFSFWRIILGCMLVSSAQNNWNNLSALPVISIVSNQLSLLKSYQDFSHKSPESAPAIHIMAEAYLSRPRLLLCSSRFTLPNQTEHSGFPNIA